MNIEIDPSQATSVLEVLSVMGVEPEDTWAEIQCITQRPGTYAVALSVRLVLDDGLIVRHISALAADETLGAAIERVAAAMQGKGLRSVDIVPGEVDLSEEFHCLESLCEIRDRPGVTQRSVH